MRPTALSAMIVSVSFTAAAVAADAPAKPSPGEQQAIAKIRQLGGLAMEVAQNDSHLEVSYLQTEGAFSDAYLAPLKELKGIVHLNLRGLPITDAQLVYIKDLTGLTELHLEKTKVTDKGLAQLKGLTNLEYLNLYGTAVTDAGVAQLAGLKKLKSLYLWQTKVTKAGVANLKKALPQVDVNLGFEAEPPKAELKADAKKPDAKATAAVKKNAEPAKKADAATKKPDDKAKKTDTPAKKPDEKAKK